MKVLRELREKRGLTLEQVAEELGLRNQYVSNYELGKRKPDYDILSKFADFYGVTVDYILGREETPTGTQADGLTEEEIKFIEWFRNEASEKDKALVRMIVDGKE